MINEASRCLDECVVQSAGYLDMAMIMGTGFPAFRGGLMRYADRVGIAEVIDRLKLLSGISSVRFSVSDKLMKMQSSNSTFY